MQQQRFGLIIHVVRNGDNIRAKVCARFFQERIARLAGRLLQRLPAALRKGGHVRPPAEKRHAQPRAKAPHEGFIRIRRRAADAVVEVRGTDRKAHGRRKRSEHVQKGDGIRPAAHADHCRRSRPQQIMLCDKIRNALPHMHLRAQSHDVPRMLLWLC